MIIKIEIDVLKLFNLFTMLQTLPYTNVGHIDGVNMIKISLVFPNIAFVN